MKGSHKCFQPSKRRRIQRMLEVGRVEEETKLKAGLSAVFWATKKVDPLLPTAASLRILLTATKFSPTFILALPLQFGITEGHYAYNESLERCILSKNYFFALAKCNMDWKGSVTEKILPDFAKWKRLLTGAKLRK